MTTQRNTGLWIEGQEIQPESREVFPVHDPGRASVLGTASRGREADVDRAVGAAHSALRNPDWASLGGLGRGRLLMALAHRIQDERHALARLLSLENGKPLQQALDEVHTTMRNFEYYAGWADKIRGRILPVPDTVFDYTLHEPLGVVAHIIPWNYPLDIFARGVAPCLAVGNTVVVKPAEETPFGAIELARMASEAGFPNGVINVVTGFGDEAGASLAAHPHIHGIAFCGSVETGKQVLATAAPNITPVISLELGGKSPCIIFPDGNLKRAIEAVARGICYNAGQSCGARSRLLIPRSSLQEAAEIATEVMKTIQIGHGLDDPDMGPLISDEQLRRVTDYVRVGMEEGATLAYGGHRPRGEALESGYFIEPTIFLNTQPGMRIVEEEIFGPVLSVLTFDSEEEAIHVANATKYGLSAEIWTDNLSRAHRVAAQLEATHVTVNGTGGFGIETPFGGLKKSGFGREGGWESILQYSRVKNVWVKLDPAPESEKR